MKTNIAIVLAVIAIALSVAALVWCGVTENNIQSVIAESNVTNGDVTQYTESGVTNYFGGDGVVYY